jgi:hypothetical protein
MDPGAEACGASFLLSWPSFLCLSSAFRTDSLVLAICDPLTGIIDGEKGLNPSTDVCGNGSNMCHFLRLTSPETRPAWKTSGTENGTSGGGTCRTLARIAHQVEVIRKAGFANAQADGLLLVIERNRPRQASWSAAMTLPSRWRKNPWSANAPGIDSGRFMPAGAPPGYGDHFDTNFAHVTARPPAGFRDRTSAQNRPGRERATRR